MHGIWAEKTGIQINQAWNFQYIISGLIPLYLVGSISLNAFFVLRYTIQMIKAANNTTLTATDKSQQYGEIHTNNVGPMAISYFAITLTLGLVSALIDPKFTLKSIPELLLGALTHIDKANYESNAYIFNSWLLAPPAYSFFLGISYIMLITTLFEKKHLWPKILATIFTALFTWSLVVGINNLKLRDYYDTLPKQLGGAKPTRVTLILEGGPEELYPSGKPDDSNRTQPLNLMYINQDFYVVKIPGKPEVYQLSKDQVKSIIGSAPKPTQENKKTK